MKVNSKKKKKIPNRLEHVMTDVSFINTIEINFKRYFHFRLIP